MSVPGRTVRVVSRERSFFSSVPIQIGRHYYGSTMLMVCPSCGLEWSDTGLGLAIRGNVRRGWGAPPVGSATVFYECLGCGHCAYDDKKAEYRRTRPAADDSAPTRAGWGHL